MTSRYPHPILDAEGRRVGVMTVDGPIVPDPALAADLSAARDREDAAMMEEAKRVSARRRAERFAELRALEDVVPRLIVPYSRLTMEERFIVEKALNAGRRVRRAPATKYGHETPPIPPSDVLLPTVISYIRKTREYRDRSDAAARKAATRAAHRLYNRGLATLEKDGAGLINIHVDRERIRHLIRLELEQKLGEAPDDIYLMRGTCENQTFSSGPEKHAPRPSPTDLPKKASDDRMAACRLLTGVRMLSDEDHAEVDWRFLRYLNDTEWKIIALLDLVSDDVIAVEYSTRFNDMSKSLRTLAKFEYAHDKSFEEHRKAVFLTLTTDPNLTDEEKKEAHDRRLEDVVRALDSGIRGKLLRDKQKEFWRLMGPDEEISELRRRESMGTLDPGGRTRLRKLLSDLEAFSELRRLAEDPNTPLRTRERAIQGLKKMNRWTYRHDPNGFGSVWEANRSFSGSWNRFMSYCTAVLGDRPDYLAAFEFTDSGLLHVHVLMFVDYLMRIDDIALEWRRIGQGEISDVCSLRACRRRDGKGWEWRWKSPNRRPRNAEGVSGGDYLKKYLKKAIFAEWNDGTPTSKVQSLYWAFNKRFNTCCRKLAAGFDEAEEKKKEETPSKWMFYRIMDAQEAADSLIEIVHHKITREWIDAKRGDAAPRGAPSSPEEVPA